MRGKNTVCILFVRKDINFIRLLIWLYKTIYGSHLYAEQVRNILLRIIISSTNCTFIFTIINFAFETSKIGVIKLWSTSGRAISSIYAN